MIELKEVIKTYVTGEISFKALKGVSLRVEEGELSLIHI